MYMSGSGASAEYRDHHEILDLRAGRQLDGRPKKSSKQNVLRLIRPKP